MANNMNNQYNNNNKNNNYRRNKKNGYRNNGYRNNGYREQNNYYQDNENNQNQMYNNGYYGNYPYGYNQQYGQFINNPFMMPTIFNNNLNNKPLFSLNNTNQNKPIYDTNFNKIITPENNKVSEKDDSKIKPKIIIRQLPKNSKDKEIVKVVPYNPENGDNISDIFAKILTDIIKDVDKREPEEISEDINTDFKLNNEIKYEELIDKHENLEDLIKIGKLYKESDKHKYAFNFEVLNKIVEPLEELNNVIGMNSVKTTIVNQIVYFLLGLEPCKDMLHTVIQGPPGVGKTMLGQLLAKIYHKMGIVGSSKKDNDIKFKIYKRADLIGQYLGHTAAKTQKAIDDSLGGVMFIDEAYALGSGSSSDKDIYSKECIDTLNQNLSEKAGQFVCIIAGYSDELDKCFFSVNEGLKRRFPFKYTIEKYDHTELARIYIKKILDNDWTINDNLCKENDIKLPSEKLINFMKTNYKDFVHFAGDMETLFLHTKIAHAIRIFGKVPDGRKIISLEDIEAGFKLFKLAKNEQKNTIRESIIASMYV
jgi:SpoVK/Ycf46/Vps4 family AAA+-type ATPase